MTELPDDELDKLFRKSEELNPDYEPEDWNALKKRLDQHDGKTPMGMLRKWWPLGLLGLFIPVAIAVYFLAGNTDLRKEKKNILTETITKPERNNKDISKNQKNTGAERKDGSLTEQPVTSIQSEPDQYEVSGKKIKEPAGKIIKNKSLKKLPRSHSKTGGVYLEPNRSERKGGDGAFPFTDSIAKITSADVNRVTDVKKNTVKRTAENPDFVQTELRKNLRNRAGKADELNLVPNNYSDSDESEKSGNERLQITVVSLENRPLIWNNLLQLPEIQILETLASEAVSEQPQAENKKSEIPQWAVRFGYSPDLSTVGFKNFSKPGAAVSLLFEYAVLSGLYVQTGVIGSVKEYSANAGEYELNKYVTQIATPETIDGTCNMLEIPFGFRYDFIQKARSRWFTGAGFSSFYVQKEKYVYNYSTYVHNARPGWEGKTGWFLLSHLNVSAGYEHRISRKLSLLAEPYIKIPLKGVGYGKVDLTTLGMWLSVRYTPVFK